MRKPWISTLLAMLSIFCLPIATYSQPNRQDDSLAHAKELWELAIAAKGGREKLHQINSFALYDPEGKDVDFMVFPDKYFSWNDTRPSKIGLIVEMFNFENGLDYTIFGDNPPDVRRTKLNPESRSRLLNPQLYYLLETKYLMPQILRAYKSKISGKSVDVVEVFVTGYGSPWRYAVFLDEKTHLPVRFGIYSNTRQNDMFKWVNLSEYREISGIKVPTAIGSKSDPGWSHVRLEINPDYDPAIFERLPDMKAGPFQWRVKGQRRAPLPDPEPVLSLTPVQITQYIKELETADVETAQIAAGELQRAGQQSAPALKAALQSQSWRLRYRAAKTLLGIKPEEKAALKTLRELLLDSQVEPEMRQNAAFGLMWSEAGIAMLRGLLKHPQVLVRRCVIFAFDEITELTEIPLGIKPAIPVLKELLNDNDEVVRGMAKEVLEQIDGRSKK
jgi:HEAT repeat protein